VIPDSYRSNFRPFYLQPPDALLSFCSLLSPGIGRGIVAPPSRDGFRSWLRHRKGGLANASGRIEFNIVLFMDWSFASGALHPASQRRSYLQLRTGQCSRPERTFTLLLVRTFRRTFPRHFVPEALRARLRSELSLRDALADISQQALAKRLSWPLRQESIRRECEASLHRLKTNVIDLYQIHSTADDLNETLEGWTTLAALQKEGKVRWIGLSNASVEEMQKLHGIARITSLQPPYSLIQRKVETEQLPWCRHENVGVIVNSPMASGLLTPSEIAELEGQ
jgi:hypothetical protein